MRGHFDLLPSIQWVGGSLPWELTSSMIWQDDEAGTIIVPVGFRTDLASVPRLPYVFALTGNRASMPAVLHDFLYHNDLVTREVADRIFYDAMTALNDPKSKLLRVLMYNGVRFFGGRHWRNGSKR